MGIKGLTSYILSNRAFSERINISSISESQGGIVLVVDGFSWLFHLLQNTNVGLPDFGLYLKKKKKK
jgi:hypothetical protein